MRTIWILGVVALAGCVGDAPASFGVEAVGVGGGGGSGGGLEVTGLGGSGGDGGGTPTESSTASTTEGTGGEDGSASSSSSSSTVEPVGECDGAERGTPCTEDGGHLCDGAGVCVEFIGVRCKLTSTGEVYACGDGTPYPYSVITETVVCHGGVTEWPYAPPGEDCVVGIDGDSSGITL